MSLVSLSEGQIHPPGISVEQQAWEPQSHPPTEPMMENLPEPGAVPGTGAQEEAGVGAQGQVRATSAREETLR